MDVVFTAKTQETQSFAKIEEFAAGKFSSLLNNQGPLCVASRSLLFAIKTLLVMAILAQLA